MRTLERAFNALRCRIGGAARGGAASPAPGVRAAPGDGEPPAYRRLVYGDADFYEFFQAVTPIDVIERMQIGSRSGSGPATRLRRAAAVPWVFAWSQSRFMLPGWFGAGRACRRRRGVRAGARERRTPSWYFLTTSSMISRPCWPAPTWRSRPPMKRWPSARQRHSG